MVSTESSGDSNSLAAQSREPGIESGIAKVGPSSPFPMRTKMRLKLLAAGIPTATSPDGADPARPGRQANFCAAVCQADRNTNQSQIPGYSTQGPTRATLDSITELPPRTRTKKFARQQNTNSK